jgi:phosphoglycolate phosphatase-like HAD superfamily hydrolase
MSAPAETGESGDAARTIQAVVFDVGETLVDETRPWGEWADWLGVPRLTFFAVLGGVIERGEEHHRAAQILRPTVDLRAEAARRRTERGTPGSTPTTSIHASPHDGGLAHSAAGRGRRQPAARTGGCRRPRDALDRRLIGRLGVRPDRRSSAGYRRAHPAIAYVGDRIDNDVRPAAAAGMRAIFIRRGPWAFLQAADGPPPEAAATIDSLLELPEIVARLG